MAAQLAGTMHSHVHQGNNNSLLWTRFKLQQQSCDEPRPLHRKQTTFCRCARMQAWQPDPRRSCIRRCWSFPCRKLSALSLLLRCESRQKFAAWHSSHDLPSCCVPLRPLLSLLPLSRQIHVSLHWRQVLAAAAAAAACCTAYELAVSPY